jgi:hypothetical protein
MMPGPLFVDGLTPDKKWIFYASDPFGSNSYAADGLTTRAIRVTSGRSYASGLLGYQLGFNGRQGWPYTVTR